MMEIAEKYKQTEIGLIPSDWEVRTLGEVGDVKMCRRIFNNETSSNGSVPFFKIGTFGKEPDAYISREQYEDYRKRFSFPRKGDILISAAGTIGRTIVYNGDDAYFQDSNIVWLENDFSTVSNEFLYHIYQVVKYNTEGGTIQRLYNSILKAAKFACPPKAEQTAIATALSDADALISSLEKLIAKKRMIKQGAMQQLLQPKEGWEVKKLGDFIRFQTGFPFPSENFTTNTKGIRLIKNRDLRSDDSIVFYTGDFNKEFIVENGDLLIGMDGDFEPVLWNKGKALLNQRLGRVNKLKEISIPFLSYVLIKELNEIQIRTSSTTVKHLSHSDIEIIETLLPSPEEQTRIATILSDMDTEIAALETKLEKYRKVKLGMMQNLLTGKIRLI